MTEFYDNIENNEEEVEILTLTDEDGNEVEYDFIDLFEYNDEEYVVLLPVEDDGSGEVVILLVEEEDEMETYSSIDDLSTLEAVFEMFKEKYKDEFNFVD